MSFNRIELNKTVLKRLIIRIYSLERENNKTKKYTNKAMVSRIVDIIEREVKNGY